MYMRAKLTEEKLARLPLPVREEGGKDGAGETPWLLLTEEDSWLRLFSLEVQSILTLHGVNLVQPNMEELISQLLLGLEFWRSLERQ